MSKTNRTPKAKETAGQAYARNVADTEALISALDSALDRHRSEQASRPKDWGFAGDLSYINDKLLDALMFMLPSDHPAKAIFNTDEDGGRQAALAIIREDEDEGPAPYRDREEFRGHL